MSRDEVESVNGRTTEMGSALLFCRFLMDFRPSREAIAIRQIRKTEKMMEIRNFGKVS